MVEESLLQCWPVELGLSSMSTPKKGGCMVEEEIAELINSCSSSKQQGMLMAYCAENQRFSG